MAQSNNVQEHIEQLLRYKDAPSWAVAQQIQSDGRVLAQGPSDTHMVFQRGVEDGFESDGVGGAGRTGAAGSGGDADAIAEHQPLCR